MWRRVWARVENRVAAAEARVPPVEARLASLEAAWRQHVPSFLNAVGTVGAFGHEVARLRREAAAQSERVREELDAGRRAVEGKLGDVEAEALRLREEVASRVGAEAGRLREEVASRVAEESGRVAVAAARAEALGPLAARLDHDAVRLDNADASIRSLWERIEFVRREILYEVLHGSGGGQPAPNGAAAATPPRIAAVEKVAAMRAAGPLRLNIGCGHIPLPDYVNVDMRELPGVDVVAEAGDLPFEPGSVGEVFSAHLLEHFPQEAMRRRLLPYWRDLLRPGGTFRAVTPDAAAMLSAAGGGAYPFEDFREVVFGAQDYAGDYHYNLFTPDSLGALLAEAGFERIEVPVAGRRNGKCFEFEIAARRP